MYLIANAKTIEKIFNREVPKYVIKGKLMNRRDFFVPSYLLFINKNLIEDDRK